MGTRMPALFSSLHPVHTKFYINSVNIYSEQYIIAGPSFSPQFITITSSDMFWCCPLESSMCTVLYMFTLFQQVGIPWWSEWPITFCLGSDQMLPCSCQSHPQPALHLFNTIAKLYWWGSRETPIALRCYSQPLNAALTLFLAHLRTWLTPAKALRCEYCGPEIDTNGPLPGCKYRSKAIQDKFWTYTWSIFVAVWLTNLC